MTLNFKVRKARKARLCASATFLSPQPICIWWGNKTTSKLTPASLACYLQFLYIESLELHVSWLRKSSVIHVILLSSLWLLGDESSIYIHSSWIFHYTGLTFPLYLLPHILCVDTTHSPIIDTLSSSILYPHETRPQCNSERQRNFVIVIKCNSLLPKKSRTLLFFFSLPLTTFPDEKISEKQLISVCCFSPNNIKVCF